MIDSLMKGLMIAIGIGLIVFALIGPALLGVLVAPEAFWAYFASPVILLVGLLYIKMTGF